MPARNDDILTLLQQKIAGARATREAAAKQVAAADATIQRLETAVAVLQEELPGMNGLLPLEYEPAGSTQQGPLAGTPPARPASDLPRTIKDASFEILRRAGGPLRLQQIADLMRQSGFETDVDDDRLRGTIGVAMARFAKEGTVERAGNGVYQVVQKHQMKETPGG
jgi:hypothetical protein